MVWMGFTMSLLFVSFHPSPLFLACSQIKYSFLHFLLEPAGPARSILLFYYVCCFSVSSDIVSARVALCPVSPRHQLSWTLLY